MIVKVCGMGDPAIMQQLATLPVDMLGFIFYPRSPRFVVNKVTPAEIEQLPGSIRKAGVFVNEAFDTIVDFATEYQLDTLQLHGSESPELCRQLKEEGYKIMKAFNLTKKNDYSAYGSFCEYFLFDTPSEQHGGTGEKFDWSLLDNYQGNVPFLLSGGIGPDDADEVKLIKHPKLAGIDINSKFEISPGIKDFEKIEKFLEEFPPNPLKGEQEDQSTEMSMHYNANPILFGFAKKMRAHPTEAEEFLWKQLSSEDFNHWHFRRQHPILFFVADFYCHKSKLIIEVDGGYHSLPQQHEYDEKRQNELEEIGLKVIRFTNEQVLFDIENTLSKIKKQLNKDK